MDCRRLLAVAHLTAVSCASYRADPGRIRPGYVGLRLYYTVV
jgi:hypothetical protein